MTALSWTLICCSWLVKLGSRVTLFELLCISRRLENKKENSSIFQVFFEYQWVKERLILAVLCRKIRFLHQSYQITLVNFRLKIHNFAKVSQMYEKIVTYVNPDANWNRDWSRICSSSLTHWQKYLMKWFFEKRQNSCQWSLQLQKFKTGFNINTNIYRIENLSQCRSHPLTTKPSMEVRQTGR